MLTGINLGGNVPYDPSKTWVDVAHLLRHWDATGPTTATATCQLAGYPVGAYPLSYRGAGTLAASGRAATLAPPVRGADGIARGTLTLGQPAGLLTLTASLLDPATRGTPRPGRRPSRGNSCGTWGCSTRSGRGRGAGRTAGAWSAGRTG